MNFITILNNIEVASTNHPIRNTDKFENISGSALLDNMNQVPVGDKDGSHFLRSNLITDENGVCLPRNNENISKNAQLVIIDCDKQLNQLGEEVEGAPDPKLIHQILLEKDIGHIIYGSYSNYVGNKGYRYRIILTTKTSYNKTQLQPTAESVVQSINIDLDYPLLAYAKENDAYAQGWYYPRKPQASNIKQLYFKNHEGQAINVINKFSEPKELNIKRPSSKISPIDNFNSQYPLTELLLTYGYKRVIKRNVHERWLSPNSTSGSAGITVKDNKFFSHHNDQFNDGYWHDAFDLMKISEGLSEQDAIKKISYKSQNSEGHQQAIEPRELPEHLPQVKKLTPEMLPEEIRGYIYDVAERQQSQPDFVAVATIVGLSGLLGRKALIRPKQKDDWTVTPNQWGAIIGRPSAMKSPSMKEALKPLKEIELEEAKKYDIACKEYEIEREMIELEIKEAKRKAKDAYKENGREAAKEALIIPDYPPEPQQKRLIVNDATVEKLGELLKENPNGLILVRDELSGWLSKLNREEYQSDRAFYLECFDGNGHYTYDRIGRGTIEIPNCTVSIIGGIQPSKIAKLISGALKGKTDDGLIQRFQLAVWPDDVGKWKWIDRAPNHEERNRFNQVFETIHNLNFETFYNQPYTFRFTPEAQELFINWMTEIQGSARSKDIHPALESHMLKMPQTISGLALLFEIIGGGRKAVATEATTKALAWADYLLSHAKRLYSIATNHNLTGAKLIISRRAKLDNPFSARDIQRKGWSGLDNSEDVNEALNWLVDYGHIVSQTLSTTETNGRPKIVYSWISATQS